MDNDKNFKKILTTELKNIACWTDIHWGKKNNSRVHNQDCFNFMKWFCEQVKKDPSITHLGFLGDWFESRSAINIETLEFSYQGLKLVNDLGLPIMFMVGNHDLHKRHTRDIHSVNIFNEFKNIAVIDEPTIVNEKYLFSPYLFNHEYEKLVSVQHKMDVIFGHFEFRNFVITGYNVKMQHGPDHTLFKNPKHIFSGHFHKRQAHDNVIYMGNTFGMDFGDAGDYERGMMKYNFGTDKIEFINWEDGPKYYKTTLTKVVNGKWEPLPQMKVKCLVDIDLTYTEAQEIKSTMLETYNLREFILEENKALKQELLEGEEEPDAEEEFMEYASIDELVIAQLESIAPEKGSPIDAKTLVRIYKSLNIGDYRGANEQ
jgi:DNA repair exonuclease SbcCD nuclease subunit